MSPDSDPRNDTLPDTCYRYADPPKADWEDDIRADGYHIQFDDLLWRDEWMLELTDESQGDECWIASNLVHNLDDIV